MLPSSPTLLPTSGEGSFISSAYGSSVFLSFSRTAGEATMPVGAFYGQDGGELARRVRVAAWLAGQKFQGLVFTFARGLLINKGINQNGNDCKHPFLIYSRINRAPEILLLERLTKIENRQTLFRNQAHQQYLDLTIQHSDLLSTKALSFLRRCLGDVDTA